MPENGDKRWLCAPFAADRRFSKKESCLGQMSRPNDCCRIPGLLAPNEVKEFEGSLASLAVKCIWLCKRSFLERTVVSDRLTQVRIFVLVEI